MDVIAEAISHKSSEKSEGSSDKIIVGKVSALDHVRLDEILVRVKEYLRAATEAHANRQRQSDEPLDDLVVYTVSDGELLGLISYITSCSADCQRETGVENVHPAAKEDHKSDQGSQQFTTMHCVTPVAVGPATTISVPQASFTPAVEPIEGAYQTDRRGSTTATILSPDGVTDITWIIDQGHLKRAGDPRRSPVGTLSTVSRISPATSSEEVNKRESSDKGLVPAGLAEEVEGPTNKPELPVVIEDSHGTRQRSSMVVTTSVGEVNPPAEINSERRGSIFTRFRKKSVQLGSAFGSFMNGDYRNADHKPRRESTVVRLQTALDRIEPSRPKHDAAIFGALTGAQPVAAVDQYNARRPGIRLNTCSEDGHFHTCVQHEMMGTPPEVRADG